MLQIIYVAIYNSIYSERNTTEVIAQKINRKGDKGMEKRFEITQQELDEQIVYGPGPNDSDPPEN